MDGIELSGAMARRHLDPRVVLKTPGNLAAACDFTIHCRQQGADTAMRILPGSVEAFVERLDELRDGAVVHVRSTLLREFFAGAFPLIRRRFVLVTGGNDWAAPDRYRHHLDNPKIVRWFGENCDLAAPHPKFEPMPVCFAEGGEPPHGDLAALLRAHARMPEVADKPLVAHASFHLTLSHPARRPVLKAVRDLEAVMLEPRRIPPELLWIRHAGHAFEISPRGAGLDCHRTWEALLLRTIPIVQHSPLDPLHRKFPIAILRDWREITPAAMAAWRERFKDRFTPAMFARLTRDHWLARIRRAAARA